MLELIPTMATSFATAMATNSIKGAKGPAQALDDVMSLVGFEKLHFYAEKKRAKNEALIKNYKEKIAQELIKIPEENIQEPKLSIVGPALEASKYYIEEEILREMFAKVIASSMDKEKNNAIHPSFVETIKQLSSNDALFLQEFKTANRLPYGKILSVENKKKEQNLPLPSLRNKQIEVPKTLSYEEWHKKYGSKTRPYIDYFYYSNSRPDLIDNEFSISSLTRLGLINIKESSALANELLYSEIDEQFNILKELSESDTEPKLIESGFHIEIRKGTIDLTPFGISFFTTCI